MSDRLNDDIVVTFFYSTRQHTKALEQMRELRLVQNLCLVLVAVYVGVTVYELIQGKSPFTNGWLWSLLKSAVMMGGLTLPFWMVRATRSQNAALRRDGAAETYRFSGDGFSLSADAPLTPWGLMNRVTQVKGAFLLKDALSNWFVYMPTTSLSPAELERLRSMISAEFSSRPNKLKLLRVRNQLAKE